MIPPYVRQRDATRALHPGSIEDVSVRAIRCAPRKQVKDTLSWRIPTITRSGAGDVNLCVDRFCRRLDVLGCRNTRKISID